MVIFNIKKITKSYRDLNNQVHLENKMIIILIKILNIKVPKVDKT